MHYDMLSLPAGYAIKALAFVAEGKAGPVTIRRIAEVTDLPMPYLAKIVYQLGQRGLIRTQRGIRGGISLTRPAEDINLYEICLALDDPIIHETCMLRTGPCSEQRNCPAHSFWSLQRERTVNFLRQTMLTEVSEFEARQRRLADAAHAEPGATPLAPPTP